MSSQPSQEELHEMVSRWVPSHREKIRIHTDTTDFFRVDYNDVLLLNGIPYLIRHNARSRFGLDDEIKYWVKRAIDLRDGSTKIIKLVFYERFNTTIGGIDFECFRSPRKEARILSLVENHPHFMHGYSAEDEKGNTIRVLDFIYGKPLRDHIEKTEGQHESYFYEHFPLILKHFAKCVRGIGFLHEHGERHGDIHRDHILIDRDTGVHRWIDFDINYRHRENIYGYDLFGLGNILIFLTAKGDVLLPDLKHRNHPALSSLGQEDMNIVFHNRVANLKKIYPYIPESLNRVLLHFSEGTNWFYENTRQLSEDLGGIEI